ncbi:LysR family transcriptional regulator ArgP [Kineococcus radiotolerans]|uniref:Transcriptional regulator, LysR family n=1 Tax=Kineococcus radiotolerans (strain ATCC BAA-149 / DSM 14245 / SRS30216) TaxID=266940 RepID=A6WF86_KINRD|nr:LysR family transcriptional regulator ArgP [Kineococcus radiotolerans]ABS05475.1 transcriptional regulator, LysR family [Kineococcus radiotolerans SRS30216 = ATCC BAA-149]
MDLDLGQLRALAAVVAEGTFEAAARVLHVTPSAVSQRIRALETSAGRVLLVRVKPVVPTEAGRTVLRLAREVELLAADARRELGQEEGTPVLPVAVNADSLATWFLGAVAPLAGEFCFDLRREDQERTGELLREGGVVAAVTAEADPVPGCSATRLGAMHYQPCASAAFARRWFPRGVDREALSRAPVVVFDRDDDLQDRWLRGFGHPLPPRHHVPATSDFGEAVRRGFGWGMLLPAQVEACGPDGVVDLDPGGGVDVELHWQRWKIRSAALDRLSEAVLAAWR